MQMEPKKSENPLECGRSRPVDNRRRPSPGSSRRQALDGDWRRKCKAGAHAAASRVGSALTKARARLAPPVPNAGYPGRGRPSLDLHSWISPIFHARCHSLSSFSRRMRLRGVHAPLTRPSCRRGPDRPTSTDHNPPCVMCASCGVAQPLDETAPCPGKSCLSYRIENRHRGAAQARKSLPGRAIRPSFAALYGEEAQGPGIDGPFEARHGFGPWGHAGAPGLRVGSKNSGDVS